MKVASMGLIPSATFVFRLRKYLKVLTFIDRLAMLSGRLAISTSPHTFTSSAATTDLKAKTY